MQRIHLKKIVLANLLFWVVLLIGLTTFLYCFRPYFMDTADVRKAKNIHLSQYSIGLKASVVSGLKSQLGRMIENDGESLFDDLWSKLNIAQLKTRDQVPIVRRYFLVELKTFEHKVSFDETELRQFLAANFDSFVSKLLETTSNEQLIALTKDMPDKVFLEEITANKFLKVDRLSIWAGFYLFILILVYYFPKLGASTRSGLSSNDSDLGHALKNPIYESDSDIRDNFAYAVQDVAERTRQLYDRSSLMLVSGLLMAFIGIVIFYLTLPADLNQGYESFLPQAIRSAGILVFIESVAWFLLRQYRALILDFKDFYDVLLRRLNFLAAFKMSSESKLTESKKMILAALLRQDEGDTAKADQSKTAGNEKLTELNQVLGNLTNILDRAKKLK